MRFRTCRRCGCQYNRAGNIVCVECRGVLLLPRLPRAQRPRPTSEPVEAAAPSRTLQVPFGPRAGEPVSTTRLALADTAAGGWRTQYVLILIVAAAGLLVVLAVRGL